MNSNHLSKRLATVSSYVEQGSRLADIGSDHAYLPIYLAKNHVIDFAVVGEVRQGPLNNAIHEIKLEGLESKLIPRLADGLAAIKPDDNFDAITIAGMGGSLISSILEEGKNRLRGNEKLILQPNVGSENVRTWLMNNSYEIRAEQIVEEDGHIYEIIVATKTTITPKYSEVELQFGPVLSKEKSETFIAKWQEELDRKKMALKNIESASRVDQSKVAAFSKGIELIEGVLAK
ncbi:tRNA (adenine(22)-N(1))-methyltransferase TrmK [Lentilactobacillus sp. Marseille-Q4993]|uniref:tRNA (adenine(22)-N(1))-methyltransferase n=1 Tax=Lentilactobacillus sp. Marseille-Q4993 TaxID=3039492 RepID=UPI0024BC2673|nr:tRNA (adenine(22)-N(1))-methyltransferase TrmK [Lentilactobacillus sp. Marseille-Q4993]